MKAGSPFLKPTPAFDIGSLFDNEETTTITRFQSTTAPISQTGPLCGSAELDLDSKVLMLARRQFQELWNRTCNEEDRWVRFKVAKVTVSDLQFVTNIASDEGELSPIEYWKLSYRTTGNIPPVIFDTQVRVVLDILHHRDAKKMRILIEAETQSGKTGILLLGTMMWQLFCETNGLPEDCFNIAPNSISIAEQTRKDALKMLEVVLSMRFAHGDGNTLFDTGYHENNHLFLRKSCSAGNLDPFTKTLDRNIAAGVTNNLFIDECDEANLDRSWFGRVLKKRHDKLSLVMLSATLYGFEGDGFDTVIKAGVSDFYLGMHDIAGRAVQRLVPVVTFEELARICDIDEASDWETATHSRKWLALGKLIAVYKAGLPKAQFPYPEHGGITGTPWNGGKGMVIRYSMSGKECDDFYDYMLKNTRTFMRGVTALRFYDNHLKMRKIKGCAGRYAEQKIRFPGGKEVRIRYKTIEDMIEKAGAAAVANGVKDFQYVIIVAHSARRGNRFPDHCTGFVEVPKKYSNSTALRQGFPGRATGNKRITSVVFVTEDNKDMIMEQRLSYLATGKKLDSGPAGSNLVKFRRFDIAGKTYIGKAAGKNLRRSITIERGQYAAFDFIFENLDRLVTPHVKWKAVLNNKTGICRPQPLTPTMNEVTAAHIIGTLPGSYKKGSDGNPILGSDGEYVRVARRGDFWDIQGSVFTKEFCDLIRSVTGQHLLLPGKENGHTLKTDDGEQFHFLNGMNGFASVTTGNYATQENHGITRRGSTGDRARRAVRAKMKAKYTEDGQIADDFNILFDVAKGKRRQAPQTVKSKVVLAPSSFGARAITIPLGDKVGNRFLGRGTVVTPEEMTEAERNAVVVLGNSRTWQYNYAHSEAEREVIDSQTKVRGGSKPSVRKKAVRQESAYEARQKKLAAFRARQSGFSGDMGASIPEEALG